MSLRKHRGKRRNTKKYKRTMSYIDEINVTQTDNVKNYRLQRGVKSKHSRV